VTFEETIAKSSELDRFLQKGAKELMPITDGEPILSISDLVAEVRKAKNEFRTGIQKELQGMANDIRANGEVAIHKVRGERKAIRDEMTGLLGNEIVDTSESADDTKSDGQAGA
jgi:hypothetical protein